MEYTKKEVNDFLDLAIEVRKNAYVKYSHFSVGAVVLGDNKKIYKGVNVENASYGLSNCAERNAIFSAVTDGVKKIETIIVVADTKRPVSPCGACRQVIKEFSTKDTIIISGNLKKEYKIFKIDELLPYGFDKTDLNYNG